MDSICRGHKIFEIGGFVTLLSFCLVLVVRIKCLMFLPMFIANLCSNTTLKDFGTRGTSKDFGCFLSLKCVVKFLFKLMKN